MFVHGQCTGSVKCGTVWFGAVLCIALRHDGAWKTTKSNACKHENLGLASIVQLSH